MYNPKVRTNWSQVIDFVSKHGSSVRMSGLVIGVDCGRGKDVCISKGAKLPPIPDETEGISEESKRAAKRLLTGGQKQVKNLNLTYAADDAAIIKTTCRFESCPPTKTQKDSHENN